MVYRKIPRREFLKSFLAGIPALALDWSSFPRGEKGKVIHQDFDAVIIGSGLGGLSCAAAFARQGFKPLVLEQHSIPGGYATTFKRKGGFVFDVSLHSTTVGDRGGLHNLIPGFPEIKEVEFVLHPELYRAVYPSHDIQVPQKDIQAYMDILIKSFPEEKEGIQGIFEDIKGLNSDISKYTRAGDQVDMDRFPMDFPYLFKCFDKTWDELMKTRIEDPELKAVLSAQWGYYGLPPSRLSSFYYALPLFGYLTEGGSYPRGRSQDISNALVKFFTEKGGEVRLRTRVDKILVKDKTA